MGNEENNIKSVNLKNEHPSDKKINTKRVSLINSKLSNNIKNQKNFMNFLIKVENGILIPNIDISNSLPLNNLCNNIVQLKNNEMEYIQAINDFTDIRLNENKNKKFYYNYRGKENKYINSINTIFNKNINVNNIKNNNIINKMNKNIYQNNNNIINYNINKNNINVLNNDKNNNIMNKYRIINNYDIINNTYKIPISNNNIKNNNKIRENSTNNLSTFETTDNKKDYPLDKIIDQAELDNKEQNEIQRPSSPNSIKTFNTPRMSNNYSNISDMNNNNYSFNTAKVKNIIYNNRMIIINPKNKKDKENIIKISNEHQMNKSPKNNSRNKNKSRNKDINNKNIRKKNLKDINIKKPNSKSINKNKNIKKEIPNEKYVNKSSSKDKTIKKSNIKANKKINQNNKKLLSPKPKSKSPDIKRGYFDKTFLIPNRNIETSFLSDKENEENKSFVSYIEKNNLNIKSNRYKNFFNENKDNNHIEINNKKKKINKLDINDMHKISDNKRYMSPNIDKNNNIYKSPNTFRKKIVEQKPIFTKKIINKNKKPEMNNFNEIIQKKSYDNNYRNKIMNNKIDKISNIDNNIYEYDIEKKISQIDNDIDKNLKKIKQINNNIENNIKEHNNINININNSITNNNIINNYNDNNENNFDNKSKNISNNITINNVNNNKMKKKKKAKEKNI